MSHPVIVLKFGSSIFKTQAALADGVHEIYRWVRQGRRVVAVVSALEGVTDSLIATGKAISECPTPQAHATLLATGELTTAALLSYEFSRIGITSELLSPNAIELRTTGDGVNADPSSINIGALRAALHRAPVVIVPGFVGIDEQRSFTLLGRGGSDLTAIFIASQLGHAQCRLIKDVDGLYERDPSLPGPTPRRFATLSWDNALTLDGGIIQHKAVRFAQERSLPVEVATLQRDDASIVQEGRTAWLRSITQRPIKVGVLGKGVVGGGVLHHLQALPTHFQISGIFVRSIPKSSTSVPLNLFSTDAEAVIRDADIVVEALGGIEPAYTLVSSALSQGKDVVTANKALIARHGDTLEALAASNGATIRYSAAVGGVVPMIETTERIAAESGIMSLEGVINGTCNYVLNQVAKGVSLSDAITQAQRLGYAEADPTRDLDGTDSLDKLLILARKAFGSEPQIEIEQQGLSVDSLARVQQSQNPRSAIRLVASATFKDNRIICRVAPQSLAPEHPLHTLEGARNRLVIAAKDATTHVVDGSGAGRWPTSEAVLADLFDSWRQLAIQPAQKPSVLEEIAHV
ncbi:MAG: homoserine dehydrogenase [Phycisphaerales bacterium]